MIKTILVDALHIFVSIMLVIFVVGCLFAATGSFDHWTSWLIYKTRFSLRSSKRRKRKAALTIEAKLVSDAETEPKLIVNDRSSQA